MQVNKNGIIKVTEKKCYWYVSGEIFIFSS